MPSYQVVPSGAGEELTVRGSTLLFKAVAATTNSAFSLHERLVPAGGRRPPAHTFGAAAGSSARLLVLHAPALNPYFRELHELWATGVPPDREQELDLMRRHGMRPTEPGS